MDKGKMTFRFDQQPKQKTDDPVVVDTDELQGDSLRIVHNHQEWGDPFTDFTGTLGDIVDSPSYPVHTPRTPWWKMAGSVTGAVVTGGLFGFVVLAMFNQQLPIPIPGMGKSAQISTASSDAVPVLGEIANSNEIMSPSQSIVTIQMPADTYYFLQYGVFSSAGGVELAQKELRQSGLAAARDTVDEKRVYAGVSTDREQAKLLSNQLLTAGVHLILHEVDLPDEVNISYHGEASELERYFAQSAALVDLLTTSSASLLEKEEPKAHSAEELKAIQASHQLWTASAAAIRGQLSPDLQLDANEMEKAMNSAVEAIGEYNKKNVKALLWEVQQEMMHFIMTQQRLLQK